MEKENEERPHDGVWDAEEDHLLSYFLGDHTSGSSAHLRAENYNLMVAPSSKKSSDSGGITAPQTPSVQYYGSLGNGHSHAGHQHSSGSTHRDGALRPVRTGSGSSSSLTSMAATLVSGGPILHQYQQPQHQHHVRFANTRSSPSPTASPLSPAATMGTPQELLMLPPPNREKTEEERQQHIAWLNQINTMAILSQQQQQQILPNAPPFSNQLTLAPNAAVIFQQPQPPTPQESEERRARRLARNRESARQSRRRKKELLTTLSDKVNRLYSELEERRRERLIEMEEELQKLRLNKIRSLAESNADEEPIRHLVYDLGPNCAIRQNCVSFQYTALKQLMLPKYQVFMLWLTVQNGSFFTAGKEERAKRDDGTKPEVRSSSRLSSKQIGEEMNIQWKKSLPKEKTRDNSKSPTDEMEEDEDDDEQALKAGADQPARLWPLFCFEMSISVDQEEKLVNFHSRAQESTTLEKDRCEVEDAVTMIMNMKRGILNHCGSTVGRSENIFVDTLSPSQSASFFKWYAENRSRFQKKEPRARFTMPEVDEAKENSIGELCRRLNRILTLPREDIPDAEQSVMESEKIGAKQAFWLNTT